MQAAFPARDAGVLALFRDLPGAQSMVQAALEGMGGIWTDSPVRPRCAVATAGDFVFCGGAPGPSAGHLLRRALAVGKKPHLLIAPEAWQAVVARVVPKGGRGIRYAFDHGVQPRDEHLRTLLEALPAGARFLPLEGVWVPWCRERKWSEDFVSLYSDEAYAARGLGILLEIGGEIVAGAGSYLSYEGGIEVQLQTRDGFEGRGYGTLAAAKLVLMAHERGLIATWDAANETSCHIAQKLGYRLTGPYAITELRKNIQAD